MTDSTERAAIALYDRFTHEGMDRRVFMTQLTRIAGGAAAASAMLTSIACPAEAAPQVAADDRRVRGRTIEWEPRAGRHYRGYLVDPARRARHSASGHGHPRKSRAERVYSRRRAPARRRRLLGRWRRIS